MGLSRQQRTDIYVCEYSAYNLSSVTLIITPE